MLTIIIPTIGRSDSFLRSLRSACSTSRALVKQIIVLDNSQEGALSEIELNSSSDDRICLLAYEDRRSMGNSWNGALSYVNQPWLLYLHDDDELIGKSFNDLGPILAENSNASFVSFDYFDRSSNGTVLKTRAGVEPLNVICSIIRNPPKFVSTIISLKALTDIGCWDDKFGFFLDLVGFIDLSRVAPPAFVSKTIGIHTVGDIEQASAVHKRAAEYGDRVPEVVSKLFPGLSDNERLTLLESLSLFIYPPSSLSFRHRLIRLMKAIKRF